MVENSAFLYLLTRDEPMRKMVLDMAGLDWLQFESVLNNAR
jgi:hypothetical protein